MACLYYHLVPFLFRFAFARANKTKRHLCKCGAGKYDSKKIVMLPGTVPSASPWQRLVATSGSFTAERRRVVCWSYNLNVFCDMNGLPFGSQSVWQPDCAALWCCCWCEPADVCSLTRELDVRIWKPWVAAWLVSWVKTCVIPVSNWVQPWCSESNDLKGWIFFRTISYCKSKTWP